jgi:deoxyadenosine/deoxycytidine kinase
MSKEQLSIPNFPIIISIEGNIGSGKTTFLNHIEEKYGTKYIYLREPVDIWMNICDSNGENILQKYYKEPIKYAFSFQMMAYLTFYQQLSNTIQNCDKNTNIICERSINASDAVFGKMLFDDGFINQVDYQILQMYYQSLPKIPLTAIIYLDVDTITCSNRISNRSRIGENNITIDYLEKCKKYHNNWIQEISNSSIIIKHMNGDINFYECINFIDSLQGIN